METEEFVPDDMLAVINRQLEIRNLRRLPCRGDAKNGEIELLAIKSIYDHSSRFFTDVKFDCLFPNGKAGEYTIRFNANSAVSDGAVFVTLVNDMFAIVVQWRPPLGRWTYEVPRGFGEMMDSAKVRDRLGTVGIADLPLGNLMRELTEEVAATAVVKGIAHLGNVAADSSTHAVLNACYLVQLSVEGEVLRNNLKGSTDEINKVELWTAKKVRRELGHLLCDSHSLASLGLALWHIESLSHLTG